MLPKHKRGPERADFLAGVITTAVESNVGINLWVEIVDYAWWSPDLSGGTAEHADGLTNAYVTLGKDEGEELESEETVIGVDDIARGLRLIRENKLPADGSIHESYRKQIVAADLANEGGDIDVELADIIVQAALFGKVIYG